MKIVIKSNEGPRHLTLFFPLSFIKTRLAARIIASMVNDEQITNSVLELQKQIKTGYQALKKSIKEKGHFNIIEVESKDGEKVLIKV